VLPVLKLSWSIDQPQVAFVYDRSTLQRMIRTLPLPVVVCHPTQLVVDQWQECVKSGLIAVAPSGSLSLVCAFLQKRRAAIPASCRPGRGQTTGVVMTRFMVVSSCAAGGHLGTNLTNSQRDLMQTS